MSTLAAADRERILDAVRAAEAKTRGEFVAVIAPKSDHYLTMPLLAAAALALLVPGVAWMFGPTDDFALLYALQLLVFVVGALAFRWPPLTMRLVPRSAQEIRARRLARERFYLLGLHATPERSGVLFFVSLAERYVEIIADEGAHNAVAPGTWDAIIKTFTDMVRAGQIVEGYVAALTAVGDALGAKLPRRPGDPNLIADRLIEL